ncbi:MAG: ParB/RepB/Spo0J family partition protein [Clostridiales bacterium]|nr:ParB/RepB/Spo0J family partition protein [Clostridiales bacterium]
MPVFDLFKQSKVPQATRALEDIDVEKIIPNPNQPRRIFDEEALEELANSIQQVGLIQPLTVRKVDDFYELVAGERRLRAVKMLGYSTVTCVVQYDVDTEESALMALIENLQRENLHYMEEAKCYADLIENYSLTQEQLAIRLGKSQSGIANKLRLLKLAPDVSQALYEAGLSERHAREIFRLKDEEAQLEAVETIAEKGLSVKETERMISKTLDTTGTEGVRRRPVIIRVMRDYRFFMNTMNDAISHLRNAGLDVEVVQNERENGVDISIQINNSFLKNGANETLREESM